MHAHTPAPNTRSQARIHTHMPTANTHMIARSYAHMYSRVIHCGYRPASDATALWLHDPDTDDACDGGVNGRASASAENVTATNTRS